MLINGDPGAGYQSVIFYIDILYNYEYPLFLL